MASTTSFFPGFAKVLFGRCPVSSGQKCLREARACSYDSFARLFQKHLPESRLNSFASGARNRRSRSYTLSSTFWLFLWQIIHPGASCRSAVQRLIAEAPRDQANVASSPKELSQNTSAYCQARARLPLRMLLRLGRYLGFEVQRRATTGWQWCGRQVKVVDGTSASMPDTESNQQKWPQPSGQKAGCGFPVTEIIGIFCLHTGSMLNWVAGKMTEHEASLWRRLWRFFRAGDIILGDRAYCSYAAMAWLKGRGVDSVFRMHQRRRSDFRCGKRLGKDDRLLTLSKPKMRSKIWDCTSWGQLPDELLVRMVRIRISHAGYRTNEVILYTTLLDPVAYPIEELAKLYMRRWQIELFFRDIKITNEMDVLRCKTATMIMRELAMHQIAYNLIRMVMTDAALTYDIEPHRLSFKGTLNAVQAFGSKLDGTSCTQKRREEIYEALIAVVARDLLPFRPERVEPRAKKRRPKNYQLLIKPRRRMKVIPHRSTYKKAS